MVIPFLSASRILPLALYLFSGIALESSASEFLSFLTRTGQIPVRSISIVPAASQSFIVQGLASLACRAGSHDEYITLKKCDRPS
jgi:hypothetical protein